MEYLAGETLAERLTRGPLPLAHALDIAAQIAEALDAAHRHGIVHRDLKPGNVMLTTSGAGPSEVPTAKLLDFGLAKLAVPGRAPALNADGTTTRQASPVTAEGTILGTLHYMAPEQIRGEAVDARTDLFAMGAVLFEMIMGSRAFPGRTPLEVCHCTLYEQPPALGGSPGGDRRGSRDPPRAGQATGGTLRDGVRDGGGAPRAAPDRRHRRDPGPRHHPPHRASLSRPPSRSGHRLPGREPPRCHRLRPGRPRVVGGALERRRRQVRRARRRFPAPCRRGGRRRGVDGEPAARRPARSGHRPARRSTGGDRSLVPRPAASRCATSSSSRTRWSTSSSRRCPCR